VRHRTVRRRDRFQLILDAIQSRADERIDVSGEAATRLDIIHVFPSRALVPSG
jgi:hypothetical protein